MLTSAAALGLVLTLLGAIAVHLRRRKNPMIVANFILLVLAAFVAYGRFIS